MKSLDKKNSSIIKVVGVGGGGSNAVNHMYRQGIVGVDFAVCNTDNQALDISPVPFKIQLGPDLTEGRGAGSKPTIGKEACVESLEHIHSFITEGTKMLFVTAGMGGGTGTGAAPVIAKVAQEHDILTVGIVTMPFMFEGKKRLQQAMEGLEELKQNVDTLIVISNDKLRAMHGNLTMSQAFAEADNVLTTAARGIAEIITVPGYVNVDFEDVNTVMRGSGVAIMGTAIAEGKDRAHRAAEMALRSPLLEDSEIKGAENILLNIASGKNEITMDEVFDITTYIQAAAGEGANLIWGNSYDQTLNDEVIVTIIATGFERLGSQKLKEMTSVGINPIQKQTVIETPATPAHNPQPQPSAPQPPKRVVLDLDGNTLNAAPKYDVYTGGNSFDLDLNTKNEPLRAKTVVYEDPYLKEEPKQTPQNNVPTPQERINQRLRDMSVRLSNPQTINELENQPAYMRRNVNLEEPPHSSQQNLSKWTVTDENGRPEIRENNSFLHDNVD
jgi:cell division protein FtsZ